GGGGGGGGGGGRGAAGRGRVEGRRGDDASALAGRKDGGLLEGRTDLRVCDSIGRVRYRKWGGHGRQHGRDRRKWEWDEAARQGVGHQRHAGVVAGRNEIRF